MFQCIRLFVYPVGDITRAKALYTALLGTEPYVDTPYYVGFRVGDQEIGLDPNGHRNGAAGPVSYWKVDDIHASLQAYLNAGAQAHAAVKDVGGGALVAAVKDADDNTIWLLQKS
jgi:predicted enzyme related to lactoylglutathione lyase